MGLGSTPINFLVLPTNKSLDLITPGKRPPIVAKGNCAMPSFLPKETIAMAEEGLYLASLLSLSPFINSFRFLATTVACFCARYPCFSSCR